MFNFPLTLAVQATTTQTSETPAATLTFSLISLVVGIVVGTLVWGLVLKFLIPAIAKKPVQWGPAFQTGAIISVINSVLAFILDLVPIPGLWLLMIPISFLVAMFAINKTRDVPLGQSAIITLVGWFVMFVATIAIAIVVGIIAVALGAAASAAG